MKYDVRIFKVENPEINILANVSVTLDDMFVVKDIKIIQGKEAPFVSMPSRLKRNAQPEDEKKYIDTFHPISAEAREELFSAILEAYDTAE